MKTRFLKIIISLICILALIFSMSYQVIAKIASTSVGTTQSFGATLVHESKNLGTGTNINYAYRVNTSSSGFTNDYRIYAGNNDYENTIICLRKDAYFPKQDESGTGNYKSLGEASESTLRTAYSAIDTTAKSNKILWLINNAVLPEDSDDLKDIKLSKIFKNLIDSQSSTQNAISISTIKNYLTEDDLVFAYQCAVWEIINPGSILNSTWQGSTNGSSWNELNSNKKDFIMTIIQYYVKDTKDDLVPTATNSRVVPKITASSSGTTKRGNRIFVGPFKIEPETSGGITYDYAVDLKFKSSSGAIVNVDNYYLIDSTFSNILKQTKSSLEGQEFYVALPINTLARKIEIKLPIDTILTTSNGTVWQAVTNSSSMQPLLSIDRTETPGPEAPTEIVEFDITSDRTYDVALRKYIYAAYEPYRENWKIVGNMQRTPNAVTPSDSDYTGNFYYHKKDPVNLKVGDRVVYGFRLINEGNSTARITQVKDYYPNYGLQYIQSGLAYNGAVTNGTKSTSNGMVTITYSGQVNAEYIAELAPNASYDFFMEFEVTETAKGKIITNIAEITDVKDGNGNSINYNNETTLDCDSYYGDSSSWLPKTDDEWQDYKGNSENKDDLSDSNYFYKGQQDDDDFEKIYVPDEKPDLALRKSAVSVKTSDSSSANELNRQRRPDTTPLKEGTGTTSNFSDEKNPVSVKAGDIVTYTIRVFNEGSVDGYASKIDDIIPEGLGFIPNHVINNSNGWQLPSNASGAVKLNTIPNATNNLSSSDIYNGSSQADVNNADVYPGPITVSTRILDPENSTLTDNDKLLKAYNKTSDSLTIKEIQVVCVVLDGANEDTLRNIAAITEYKDKDKNIINYPDEIDSNYNNNLNNFNENNHEDDEDFEKLTLSSTPYDLALKKYVSSVKDATNSNKTIPDSQKRSLNVTNSDALVSRNNSTDKLDAVYSFGVDKAEQPVQVQKGDSVVYTIRLYNEGLTDAKVTELIDTVPEGLTLIDKNNSSINSKYDWEPITSSTGWTSGVKTDYLNGKVIPAFDKNKGNEDFNETTEIGKQQGISYTEVKIEFKVTTSKNSVIKNIAEITNDDGDDNDSTPNNKDENEDDEDFDNIIPIPYDLALKKFVSEVRDATNAKKTIPSDQEREAIVTSVDSLNNGTSTDAVYKYGSNGINKDQVPVTVEKNDYVTYTIRVYNEGLMDGQATKIVDQYNKDEIEYLDNEFNRGYGWVDESSSSSNSGKITTEFLKEKFIPKFKSEQSSSDSGLKKDESGLWYREVKVQFKVKTSDIKKLRNTAEIVADDGDDIDSKPNGRINSNTEEDDEDFDVIIPKGIYDLALKKYVSSVSERVNSENEIDDEQKRELRITNVDKLKNRSSYPNSADANYDFGIDWENTPVDVSYGNYVTYTIRVYNEGTMAAKVGEIIDSYPDELVFIEDSDINETYGWGEFTDSSSTGWKKGIKTRMLANTVLQPFDSSEKTESLNERTHTGWDKGVNYAEVKVQFRVNSSENEIIKNIAEISIDDGDDDDSYPNNKDENEDDEDYDIIVPNGIYDLALKKYVASIKDENNIEKNIADNQKRELKVTDVSLLESNDSNEDHDATYEFGVNKLSTPVRVQKGDYVVYTIRVYNEGNVPAKVEEVIDSIPTGLTFDKNREINKKYGWEQFKSEEEDGWTTGLSSKYFKDTTIPAFNSNKQSKAYDENTKYGTDMGVSFVELQIEYKVDTSENNEIRNIAEIISDDGDDDDSIPNDVDPEEDDYDIDIILPTKFDLSLRKFITQIESDNINDRVPKVETSALKDDSSTTAKYTHTKEPRIVTKGQTVIYTIRVYNEGSINGYVAEIKDDIPQGLTYLPNHEINKEFGWKMYDSEGKETSDVSKAKTIRTAYGAKTTNSSRMLNKFDKSSNEDPASIDVKVAFKVTQDSVTDGNTTIINTAEITKETDEEGNPIDDIDSDPDNNKEEEDDIDKEYLKLQYFDLSLLKYISKVIVTENGVTKETETKYDGSENPEPVVKVELNKKNLSNTQVKYVYSIKVTNEGQIQGYAKEVTDRIPAGLAFYEEDNKEYNWKIGEKGIVTTDYLANKLLKPGESATLQIVLRWENSGSNLGQKVNVAEITKDENPYGVPDIDSTPNNNKDGEDDQDQAIAVLSITTGSAPLYIALTTIIVAILGAGLYLIYKHVVKK